MIPKLEISKPKELKQKGLFEDQTSYLFVKCIECKKEVVKVWDYYTNKYNEDKNILLEEHYYNEFCCKKCKEYFEDINYFFEIEEQEIRDRDNILELEYIANIKKREPHKSSLVKIKIIFEKNWISGDKYKTEKIKKYVTNCGEHYEYISHTLTQCTELHKNCRVCKIIAKISKATKLNDYEVLNLWQLAEKLDYTVESRNYKIIDNCLYHRSDLEFIKRKKDKLIINDSQQQHINFGYFGRSICCPRFWRYDNFHRRILRLPLTQIAEIGMQYSNTTAINMVQLVEDIEIIENKDNWRSEITGTLFRLYDKYMWFKRDEAQECLIILPKKVSSIKEANESLKPKLLENETKGFTRVGDYFFIETKEDFKQYDKSHYEIAYYEIVEHYGNSQAIEELKKMLVEYYKDKIEDQDKLKQLVEERYIGTLEDFLRKKDSDLYKNDVKVQEIINKILKEVKPIAKKGKLIKYPIYDSNHIATNSFNLGLIQFVKGYIYHQSREHRRIKLDNWHLVLKNEAIDSFNVSASGAYRD